MQNGDWFSNIDRSFLKQVEIIRLLLLTAGPVSGKGPQISPANRIAPQNPVRIANGAEVLIFFQLIIKGSCQQFSAIITFPAPRQTIRRQPALQGCTVKRLRKGGQIDYHLWQRVVNFQIEAFDLLTGHKGLMGSWQFGHPEAGLQHFR